MDFDISEYLNVSDPESHCNQDHDHSTPPWPLPECTWQEQLAWSQSDTGFNEGAQAAAELVTQYGLGLPAPVAGLAGDALANIWPRRDMMAFAISLAKTGMLPQACSIAVVSQWHNCHAFRCLIFHAPEVAVWLTQQ
jgi:hypothetical protein